MIELNVCYYCNCSIDDYSRTVDHKHPKSRGGILSNKNKVPSCVSCNRLKGNMTIKEFLRSIDSTIFLEVKTHKEKINYLRHIKMNLKKKEK